MSLGSLGGAAFVFTAQRTGERTTATVTGCVQRPARYGGTSCTGRWVSGGSLVGGGGHVERGTIEGADKGDLGKTLDVHVSGGRAYTESLRLPIVLAGIGLAFALGGAYELRRQLRQARPS
jgi:hypothetical protein